MNLKPNRKQLINFGKIALSFLLLYFVFQKIPLSEVLALWKTLEIFPFLLAALFFLLSQVISTYRLGYFLKAESFPLSFLSNLKLYFLGMFYNFFIPGGIGGDAYKIYILNKTFRWSAKKLTISIFNDRLNGLFAIVILVLLFSFVLLPEYKIWLIVALMVVLIGGCFFLSHLFPTYKMILLRTLGLSLLIQALQALSFVMLLRSLWIEENLLAYALLFLGSSILSLLSFAGIGTREMLFLLVANYFLVDSTTAVSASVLFTAITAFFSLFGLIFQIRTLNLKTTEKK